MEDPKYAAVRQAIRAAMDQPGYDDGSAGPLFVRCAWHASGTFAPALAPSNDSAKGGLASGGSNGGGIALCPLEAADPANAGLSHDDAFLKPVRAAHPWISLADLFTLAGVEAVEAMGGPRVPWLPGRTDFDEGKVDEYRDDVTGRLPDASLDANHIRSIFYRMGFNDQEIVALSGAHNLGRCHADRSGYHGPWVLTPTRFSNTYFRYLLQRQWTQKEWDGPKQFQTKIAGKELMMLPTDLALVSDPSFRKYVELYAKEKETFYTDFAAAFAKLIELGVQRDPKTGLAQLSRRIKDGQVSELPSDCPHKPSSSSDDPRSKL